jgi:hypothetical protein
MVAGFAVVFGGDEGAERRGKVDRLCSLARNREKASHFLSESSCFNQ